MFNLNKHNINYISKSAILILLSAISLKFYARTTITVELEFDINDFDIISNQYELTEIHSVNGVDYFKETNEPGIPAISNKVKVPKGFKFEEMNYEIMSKTLLSEQTTLAGCPMPISTDAFLQNIAKTDLSYDSTCLYPRSNCEFIYASHLQDSEIFYFLSYPFVYDSAKKNLYFVDKIELSISGLFEQADKDLSSDEVNLATDLKELDYNKSDYSPETKEMSSNNPIDYLIITNNELKDSFEPLMIWKRIKGLQPLIVTIEEIRNKYEGYDDQLKIKKCIYDLYKNHSLKYVLLGGHDKVIPVRGCFGRVIQEVGYATDNTIPTDMYYACFGGDFDWNANGNDIFGELDDNIDMTQSIYVTRTPVHSTADVDAFVNKIIDYEKSPLVNKNILLSGNVLTGFYQNGKSDAEIIGDKIYEDCILPFWDGQKNKFYDTYTDFSGGANYNFNANNLKNQISKGYSFVEISTHGMQTYIDMEGGGKYDTSHGKSQTNAGHTIITTTACYTNAFDYSTTGSADPCLSESLIRNPNSGIIAYLGCSRKGWGYGNARIGASHEYEGQFFKNLFSKDLENKSLGVIAAKMKESLLSYTNGYGSYRWVHFGLNPIGDPEMPIFTEFPCHFDNFLFTINNSKISIDTGIERSRICISDLWDYGEGFHSVVDGCQNGNWGNIPTESIVCFTKQGYIPKIINLTIIQNKTFATNRNISNDVVLLGSSLTTDYSSGPVTISSGETSIRATQIVLGPGTSVTKGAILKLNAQ